MQVDHVITDLVQPRVPEQDGIPPRRGQHQAANKCISKPIRADQRTRRIMQIQTRGESRTGYGDGGDVHRLAGVGHKGIRNLLSDTADAPGPVFTAGQSRPAPAGRELQIERIITERHVRDDQVEVVLWQLPRFQATGKDARRRIEPECAR